MSVELTGLNLRDDVLLSWSLNLNGPGWGDGVTVLVVCRCPSLPLSTVVTSTADFCVLVFGRHVVVCVFVDVRFSAGACGGAGVLFCCSLAFSTVSEGVTSTAELFFLLSSGSLVVAGTLVAPAS